MKIDYFNLYGRAECIKMALWKAGVEYESVGYTGDSWKELKESGKLRFGQIPMLELDDGTCLFQTNAIIQYVGAKYGLVPEDPMQKYKGQMLCDHFWGDFITQVMKIFRTPEGPEREAAAKELFETHFPNYLKQIEKSLGDSKFLIGDTITIYDT